MLIDLYTNAKIRLPNSTLTTKLKLNKSIYSSMGMYM